MSVKASVSRSHSAFLTGRVRREQCERAYGLLFISSGGFAKSGLLAFVQLLFARFLQEPGPLMKLGVSGRVWLIGQVCPGLRLPLIEVSSEGSLCSRHCTLLCSTPTAQTLPAPLSAVL
ncbi:hypothetical protein LDENG_00282210 [Lucifuga dentata]|nr:hypothetical protein LDENG_00282210 [Lucifuga dentata]